MINEIKFLERARKKHGEYYSYRNMNYKNYTTPITITCPLHGDFEMTPRDHASKGYGCPKCGIEKRANKRRDTKDNFVKKAEKKHNHFYDYSKVDYKTRAA